MNSYGRRVAKVAIEYANGTRPASARPVAIPIMFCSATPALKNLVGNRSAKGSRTVKPTSPVTSTIRSSWSARSISARTKASLKLLRVSDVREREPVLLVGHRPVVPRDLPLHVADALAENRSGDQDVRRAVVGVELLEFLGESGHVVAVDLVHIPAERAPALGER